MTGAGTINHIANDAAKPTDFNRPGRVQPLYSQDGGLRKRIGATPKPPLTSPSWPGPSR
ncbi:3,4-dihydroxy-2-butanone-4-phosphate synthase [Limosilactobacillus fermentum]